jgi:hypothetical protein
MEELDIEDIEDIEEKEDSPLKKFLKRGFIVFILVFMASLFIINSAPGYHVISVLSGRVVSSTLEQDYTFALRDGSVVFEREVYEELRQMYWDNQRHEFKVCLTGEKADNDYLVQGMYIPVIISQDVYSVTAQLCNKETIISLHSHPPMRCIFSEQDIRYFNVFRDVNPEGIIGLMCGEERLTFYGY